MSSDEWEDEWPIIKRIADRYKNCSITISEQPEFAVVEAVLRCAAEEGLVLVASKQDVLCGTAPSLPSNSQHKLQTWFRIATERLQAVLDEPPTCICHADSPWLCPVHAPIKGRETKQ